MGVTGYGRADKGQVGRMVAVILRLAEVPTPDDAADALAIAISCANAERPGDRLNAGAGGAKAAVMDRAAVDPIVRGETPYERSVREALALEKKAAAGAGSGRR
jgi:crossover junction endodeoxyribonuclease RuvC